MLHFSSITDEEAREAAGAILLEILEMGRGQDKVQLLMPLLQVRKTSFQSACTQWIRVNDRRH